MASPYSTAAQCRANDSKFTSATDFPDATINNRIAIADNNSVEIDIGNVVDFSLVPNISATPATPNFINSLSQYKTMELMLVYYFSAKRKLDDNGDIAYWSNKYDALVAKILNKEIPLELSDGTDISNGSKGKYSQRSRPGVKPPFGQAKYGEFLSDDDLLDKRPLD